MPWQENDHPSIMERKAAMLLDQGDILYVTEFSFPDLWKKKDQNFFQRCKANSIISKSSKLRKALQDSRLTIRESVPTARLKVILQSQFRILSTIQ